MRKLYAIFNELKIKPNLIQTGAIGLQISVDDIAEKIDSFGQKASLFFDVQIEKGLNLLTLRHYNEETLQKHLMAKEKVLMQQNEVTIQAVYR